MKSIILTVLVAVMIIIIDQKSVLAKPNPKPWFYGRSNNFPNSYIVYFPDEYEKLLQNQPNPANQQVNYGPEIPIHINHVEDYSEPINGVEVGDRTSLTSPVSCPQGTVYSYGRCRNKWNRG